MPPAPDENECHARDGDDNLLTTNTPITSLDFVVDHHSSCSYFYTPGDDDTMDIETSKREVAVLN